jgi:hypothetical protein
MSRSRQSWMTGHEGATSSRQTIASRSARRVDARLALSVRRTSSSMARRPRSAASICARTDASVAARICASSASISSAEPLGRGTRKGGTGPRGCSRASNGRRSCCSRSRWRVASCWRSHLACAARAVAFAIACAASTVSRIAEIAKRQRSRSAIDSSSVSMAQPPSMRSVGPALPPPPSVSARRRTPPRRIASVWSSGGDIVALRK